MLALVQTIRREWQTVKAAPVSFLVILLAALGVGFAVGQFLFPLEHQQSASAQSSAASQGVTAARLEVSSSKAPTTVQDARIGSVSSTGQRQSVTAGSVGTVNLGRGAD